MIYDILKNWKLYFNNHAWRLAFEYLESLKADTQECQNLQLQGQDITASVMNDNTRAASEFLLGAHNIFIDIQATFCESEDICWHPRKDLVVKSDYDAQHDRIIYEQPDQAYARVSNLPGLFSVFFPTDAHMLQQTTGLTSKMVKKIVVKVSAELIGYDTSILY